MAGCWERTDGSSKCEHCGEEFDDDDARAEIAECNEDGEFLPNVDSIIVHMEPCGTYLLNRNYNIA